MGNSSGKESRSAGDRRSGESASRSPPSSGFSFGLGPGPNDGRLYTHRGGRNSRHDLGFFGSSGGPSEREADPNGPRRETRQEREARKLEKERKLRAQERERSLKEEDVDGGYLVTLGTYVGPEDFSKPTVRKLQLERRLAPFWRGLNDHSGEWTEHQLVAAARGLPIPAPDEIPAQEESPNPNEHGFQPGIVVPIPGNPTSDKDTSNAMGSATLHVPAFGAPAPSSYNANSAPSSLFLGRTKGLASLSPPKNIPQPEIARQEIRLPRDRTINGQPVEAYLYKDPGECPICFLYYPPFLNRTRCCDQPICSECFVQIKRPDPHPPEHTDPNIPPPEDEEQRLPGEEQQLVSEQATCPFCVMPEFGITYDPPPFRRGLIYADQPVSTSPIPPGQNSLPKRRRGQSVSATAPEVITTDMVRPDWARKLADARAHAARRSAAATALHTAAYMMNAQGGGSQIPGLGRRRRTGDGSGLNGGPHREMLHPSQMEQLMAVLEGQESSQGQRRGNHDLFPIRTGSRPNRTDDLEELMILEAIRLSLQAEEERKKKEEKETAKAAKKEEKQRAKEQKKAEKAAKKNGSYTSSRNNSQFFSSNTNLSTEPTPSQTPQPHAPNSESDKGKGKALVEGAPRMTGIGFKPLEEPTSVLNEVGAHSDHAQGERANEPVPPTVRVVMDDAASTDATATARTAYSGTAPGLEQDFNFGSLAEMIDKEAVSNYDHVEDASQEGVDAVPGSNRDKHRDNNTLDAYSDSA